MKKNTVIFGPNFTSVFPECLFVSLPSRQPLKCESSSCHCLRSALQSLHKACEVARCHNYYPGSLFLTWVSYYQSRVSSNQFCINEWNAMQDVESHRANSPVLFTDLWVEEEREMTTWKHTYTHTHTLRNSTVYTDDGISGILFGLWYIPDRESFSQVFILYARPPLICGAKFLWEIQSEFAVLKIGKLQYPQEILCSVPLVMIQ